MEDRTFTILTDSTFTISTDSNHEHIVASQKNMNQLWANNFSVPEELMEMNKLPAPIVENNALVSSKPNPTVLTNSPE